MVEERRRIVFDNKIPLTWLLSSSASVLTLLAILLWNVAAQSNKLDQLISQMQKLDRANEVRDSKLESFAQDANNYKRDAEIIKMRLDVLEKAKNK